ncbi:MAG: hypothetical protein ACYDC1_08730 [Limisphaerales bacterium]
MILSTPIPFALAVQRLNGKTPIGSKLRSAEWAGVPLALRERAQFTAGIESARIVQGIQDWGMRTFGHGPDDHG